MKRKSRVSMFLIALSLIISLNLQNINAAEDFSGKEEYWSNLCGSVEYWNNEATCGEFRTYLRNKSGSSNSEKEALAAERKAIEGNIVENLGKIEEYRAIIKEYETQIANVDVEIAAIEKEIAVTQTKIEERQMKIAELEEDLKEYMVNVQGTMRINGYIEFLMGSSDFADIVRRIEAMSAIRQQNAEMATNVLTEREALSKDQAMFENQKVAIEDKRLIAEIQRNSAKEYEGQLVFIGETLAKEKTVLETKEAEKVSEVQFNSDIADKIGSIDKPKPVVPKPDEGGNDNGGNDNGGNDNGGNDNGGNTKPPIVGNGFINPTTGYHISATVWSYPGWLGGGTHLGTDFAAATGNPIYATGTGVVVVAKGGCATSGSFSCNGGMGNYMSTIVKVGDKVYGTLMMHMQANSFAVSPGDFISAGQVIGRVGNSGASTGSHVHVELFDLGTSSLQEAINNFNAYQRDGQFGLGGSSGGQWSRCDVKGSTPCRLNPENYYPI